jgi:hypothetical protein
VGLVLCAAVTPCLWYNQSRCKLAMHTIRESTVSGVVSGYCTSEATFSGAQTFCRASQLKPFWLNSWSLRVGCVCSGKRESAKMSGTQPRHLIVEKLHTHKKKRHYDAECGIDRFACPAGCKLAFSLPTTVLANSLTSLWCAFAWWCMILMADCRCSNTRKCGA